MTLSSLLVTIALTLRAQWDTDGEPLVAWDWWRGMGPWAPRPEIRRWFVRSSPFFVAIGLVVFGIAALFVH